MGKLDFYYQSKKVNEDIENWHDLEIQVQFDDESGQGSITSGQLEFVNDLAVKLNAWNDGGMNNGPGIYEAPEFRIEACGNSKVFEGGVDTADCESLYECNKVITSLRADKINSLNDRASGFTFAYLASLQTGQPGKISQSDYVRVPYVINSIPDMVQVMTSAICLFTLIRELQSLIQKIKNAIIKLVGDVSTALSCIPVVNVALAIAIGQVLVDIAAIVLLVFFAIFVIKALVELVLMIFDNLIQRVKYKKGIRVRTAFQKACDYLGYTFSSSILTGAHKDEVIVPRKSALFTTNPINLTTVFGYPQKQKNRDDNFNPASVGYIEGTFAELIVIYEDRFSAEIRIIGNTLHFERSDYFANLASYTLPNIKNKNADPHGTNACENTANYLIAHALDDQETNTYDHYEGTSAYMALSPIAVTNKKNLLLRGITEKRMPLALAKRKTSLSPVEALFSNIYSELMNLIGGSNSMFGLLIKTIAKQLQAITTLTGGNSPIITLLTFPANPFAARIGMMMLSNDFTGVAKVMIVDGHGKLVSNNEYLTSARYLMDNFHFINFAVRTTDTNGTTKNDHNQWLTYDNKEIPFCCDDYTKLLNNNYFKTYDGKTAKAKSLIWKPHTNTARITYAVKQQYTKNLKNNYVIDGK